MNDASVYFKKKTGRPATGRGTLVGVSVPASALAALDAYIAAQPEPKPGRPEAIRRILAAYLQEKRATSD